MCTSACPVTVRWLLDANGPSTLLLLRRRGWSIWSCWSPPNFRPNGPTILHSIQNGYCFVTCFSLMRTGPNTCMLVSTVLANIYHWWKFWFFRGGCWPKTLILRDEELDAMVDGFSMCSGEISVGTRRYERGAFRPDVTRSRSTALLYVHFPISTRYRLSLAHV